MKNTKNGLNNPRSQSLLRDQLKLYLVTDQSWTKPYPGSALENLCLQIQSSLEGGVSFLQYREKNLSYSENLKCALELQKLAKTYQVPFIINDDVDLALEIHADGVHVGQTDLHFAKTRIAIGSEMILGVSVNTVEQAQAAELAGADYLGVGAMFPTSTKLDAKAVTLDDLKAICESVQIPVVAIGGIAQENVTQLKDSGIAGIAVISAILAKEDQKLAAQELLKLSECFTSAPLSETRD